MGLRQLRSLGARGRGVAALLLRRRTLFAVAAGTGAAGAGELAGGGRVQRTALLRALELAGLARAGVLRTRGVEVRTGELGRGAGARQFVVAARDLLAVLPRTPAGGLREPGRRGAGTRKLRAGGATARRQLRTTALDRSLLARLLPRLLPTLLTLLTLLAVLAGLLGLALLGLLPVLTRLLRGLGLLRTLETVALREPAGRGLLRHAGRTGLRAAREEPAALVAALTAGGQRSPGAEGTLALARRGAGTALGTLPRAALLRTLLLARRTVTSGQGGTLAAALDLAALLAGADGGTCARAGHGSLPTGSTLTALAARGAALSARGAALARHRSRLLAALGDVHREHDEGRRTARVGGAQLDADAVSQGQAADHEQAHAAGDGDVHGRRRREPLVDRGEVLGERPMPVSWISTSTRPSGSA